MSGESIVLIVLGFLTLIGATFGPYLQYRINKGSAPMQRDVSVAESAKSIIEGGNVVNEMLVKQLERMSHELEKLRKESEEGKVINGKGIPEAAGPVIYDKLREIENSINLAIETMATRQRILLQTVQYPVFEANPEGRIIWVNKAAGKFVGMSESELLEDGWYLAVHPEDQDRVHEEWQRAIKQKSLYSSKFRCRLSDGGYTVVHSVAHPVINSKGEVSGYLGFITRDNASYDEAVETVLEQIDNINKRIEGVDENLRGFREDYEAAVERSNKIFAVAEENRKKIEAAGVEGLSRLPYDPNVE